MSDEYVKERLTLVYEEILWLAKRSHVTSAAARSWYTHVAAVSLKKHIRRFTGMVSKDAIRNFEGPLRLEHFKRIQTNLTDFVSRHHTHNLYDPEEFINFILDSEQVHVVTIAENYTIMKTHGDYSLAGIELIPWKDISTEVKFSLWKRILRNRVSNAVDYKMQTEQDATANP